MYEYEKFRYCPKCKGKLKEINIEGFLRLQCIECSYIIYRNPYPAVSIIIEKEKKIVLIKRKIKPMIGYWALPSGFVEYEEDSEEAAAREVLEETGLKVKVIDLIDMSFFSKVVKANVIGACYYAKIISGTLKSGSDVSEVAFFNLDKLPENFAFRQHLISIEKWRKKHGR